MHWAQALVFCGCLMGASIYDVQIKNFRILYGDEWRETVRRFAKETLVYDPSNQYALEILEPNSTALGSANTNWFDEVKQTAIRHNADLTVSGGSKVSKP